MWLLSKHLCPPFFSFTTLTHCCRLSARLSVCRSVLVPLFCLCLSVCLSGMRVMSAYTSGLTSAMYIKDGQPVPTPDPQSGLYICNRAGQVVQATIPPGHIAYQLGQVIAIQSGGLLRATPHYVRAPAASGPGGISRNTFAVFMQPEVDVVLNAPKGLEALGGVLCMDSGHWSPGMTFGAFAEHTLNGYYQLPQGSSSSRDSDEDQGHVPGTPDYPPAAGKDVAPAAVHLAAAAAGTQLAQLFVSHQ